MNPRVAPPFLHRPHPRLPPWLDSVSERWAGLRPRVRALVAATCLLAVIGGAELRAGAVASRWGGAPVRVWVAASDLPVGAEPDVEAVLLPPAAIPPEAVSALPDGGVLALALPRGSVLTRAHLHPTGPAAGLAGGLRAVPIPVEEGWGVAAGGWVDVWVLGTGEHPALQVARGRPVIELHVDGSGRATALVGLDAEEVGPATQGLALGRVLLAHAPPPGGP